jgi:hypothetical protein
MVLILVAVVAACSRIESPVPSSGGDVAIVVLDQFSDVLSQTGGPQATGHCLASGMSSNEVGSGGGAYGATVGPHGVTVFNTVADELNRSGRHLTHLTPAPTLATGGAATSIAQTDSWSYGGHTIYLVGVDTASFDTDTITRNLQQVMDSLNASESITRFVINMSFYLAPCDLTSWYQGLGVGPGDVGGMLRAYQQQIIGNPGVAGLSQLIKNLVGDGQSFSPGELLDPTTLASTEPLAADPTVIAELTDIVLNNLYYGQFVNPDSQDLTKFLENRKDVLNLLNKDPLHDRLRALVHGEVTGPGTHTSYQVIPVAAAGNGVTLPDGTHAQLPIPTAPAMWNDVVSVSAGLAPDTSGAHAGTPSGAAEALRLESFSNAGEVMMADAPHSGTSFAAPHLSALEALYLLHNGPVTCDGNVPPLGYADIDASPPKYTWNNMGLDFRSPSSLDVPAEGPALTECAQFENLAR